VLFAGMVEGTDKRWLLQHCRFMAAPSIEESFGNVALEAMACGKPVLASKASGFAEIVKDRMNGRLVEVGDVPSLSDALREMMSADLTAPSTAASDTAQDFAWTSIAQRYDELARSLQSSF
jgi:glycosyltransferase involved in cell wall biosynthesis